MKKLSAAKFCFGFKKKETKLKKSSVAKLPFGFKKKETKFENVVCCNISLKESKFEDVCCKNFVLVSKRRKRKLKMWSAALFWLGFIG